MRQQSTLLSAEASDEIIVKDCLAGDERAFEILFQRYNPALFNFIYHFFGDYDQTCDILQQVFLQLYLSLRTLDTSRPLKHWLFQVARNRCLDEVRRHHAIRFSELSVDENEQSILAEFVDARPLPDEVAELHNLQEQLQRVIQQLPPKFRSVVMLRCMSLLRFAEIGRALGMPENTAKTYFSRARPLLQASLKEAFHNDSPEAGEKNIPKGLALH